MEENKENVKLFGKRERNALISLFVSLIICFSVVATMVSALHKTKPQNTSSSEPELTLQLGKQLNKSMIEVADKLCKETFIHGEVKELIAFSYQNNVFCYSTYVQNESDQIDRIMRVSLILHRDSIDECFKIFLDENIKDFIRTYRVTVSFYFKLEVDDEFIVNSYLGDTYTIFFYRSVVDENSPIFIDLTYYRDGVYKTLIQYSYLEENELTFSEACLDANEETCPYLYLSLLTIFIED